MARCAGTRDGDDGGMRYTLFDLLVAEQRLMDAQRRALIYRPFSAAWDVAMRRVEEAERRLWVVQQAVATASSKVPVVA